MPGPKLGRIIVAPTRPSGRKASGLLAVIAALLVVAALGPPSAAAQDRLQSYPGYERFARSRADIWKQRGKIGQVRWSGDARAFDYNWGGSWYHFDIESRTKEVITAPPTEERPSPESLPCSQPARGRQYECALSPDGMLLAFYRDRNLWIRNADGGGERAVTTAGNYAERTKYGTGTWVYGEELSQNTAMWWSPDGKKLAYYGFDESPVPVFYLLKNQTGIQNSLETEAYPKAGANNPIVELFVYDLKTQRSTRMDIRDGKPFQEDVPGYYTYRIAWTPEGDELTIHRTNRRQNIMELAACDPSTGECRVVVHEEWLHSWVENRPTMRYLSDGKRFVWTSERTGFKNLYLYNLSGKLLATLTNHPFEVAGVVRIDEKAGIVWYMARDGDNPMKPQLHRVGFDGQGDRRLTDPAFHHRVQLSPDGRHFIDVSQTHDQPPASRLLDGEGQVIAELATTDMSKFDELGLKRVEMFTFTAADGKTQLHGKLSFPSNFDPARKYPIIVGVYNGPGSGGVQETFTDPPRFTEFGFLYVTLEARSARGRGKRFLDAIYGKLGVVEVDDVAAGVRSLWSRPYVDRHRVGITGNSYGGYVAAMALARYPDVFHVAVAASPVTDWRHYDTIYTERYMWTPEGNEDGYDAGSIMTYVDRIKGRLLLGFGTADDNVHPNNSLELIQALRRAGKSFDVHVGPDIGHISGLTQSLKYQFLIENLAMKLVPIE